MLPPFGIDPDQDSQSTGFHWTGLGQDLPDTSGHDDIVQRDPLSEPPALPRVPAPGTQLIKRYKSETLTVTVLEDGYRYGDRVYKSLSAIARQVTGTQWNGYLFFSLGLRKEQGHAE